jgi:predicted RNA-binding protein YlqC (UPF0109 family)
MTNAEVAPQFAGFQHRRIVAGRHPPGHLVARPRIDPSRLEYSKDSELKRHLLSSTGARPMKELLRIIVAGLVTRPDAIEISETKGDSTTLLLLRVAKEDVGRVIGKQGQTAQSIRTILSAVGARNNRKVVLEIAD